MSQFPNALSVMRRRTGCNFCQKAFTFVDIGRFTESRLQKTAQQIYIFIKFPQFDFCSGVLSV